ncbi:MAG: hypothetical protein J2P37_08255 [Ktedonobacteraceae bacterium]|nr:hypothetical protein [Ktedonobacteraceae bacterium]
MQQQQQQQHADYDLLAVFSNETKADAATAKLHKEGFGQDEVYQLTEGSAGQRTFRVHGPNQRRGDYFLQTRRSGPNPIVVVLFALIFAIVLGGVGFGASTALPQMLPEPATLLGAAIVGLVLGAITGFGRRGRVRGAIGQAQVSQEGQQPVKGARNVVALRFNDPDNISRKSRARAILLNNEGKIDRSVGRQRE